MSNLPKISLSFCLLMGLVLGFSLIVLGGTPDESKVESVEVQLKITGQIYEGLQERIEFSICRVGEKILLSQPLSLLEQNRESLKLAIYNVFSKVLAGFKIETIDMNLQEHTRIIIRLKPQEPLITKINLKLEYQNISPEMIPFFQRMTDRSQSELNQIFKGLPVAALPWAEDIINLVARYIVEREFPGFQPSLFVKPPVNGEVDFNLQLTPQGKLVKEIAVQYSSTTIPIYVVRSKLSVDQDKLDILKGMPSEFLIHYQPELEDYLIHSFNNIPNLKKLGLNVSLSLSPAERTGVGLKVDSAQLRTNLELRTLFGDQDYSYIQAYLGYNLQNYEIYTKLLAGDHPSDHIKMGIKIPLSSNFYGGFEYQLENHLKSVGLYYQFERGDYFHIQFGLNDAPDEAVIGIRINKHFNLELVEYDQELGAQLMFHLW